MSRRKPRIRLPLTIQCSCCDYVTLREQGANEVCPVCFWEDDGVGLNKICQPSHANDNLTLLHARKNYQKLGACNSKWLAKVCSSQDRNNFERLSRQYAAFIFEVVEAAAKRGIASCISSIGEEDDEIIAYDLATEKSGFLSYSFVNHGLNQFHRGSIHSYCKPDSQNRFREILICIADELSLSIEFKESWSYEMTFDSGWRKSGGWWLISNLLIKESVK